MRFEVEQKFRVQSIEFVERRLQTIGTSIGTPVRQVDLYFSHPSRDFNITDEAFRIRSVEDDHFLTYKGPKVDSTTKTRREIELPIASGDEGLSQWIELLEALGFRPTMEVTKLRRTTVVDWMQQPVEVALDEVPGLGNFVELELVTDADEEQLDSARSVLAAVAGKLGLEQSERRSYLELLLEKQLGNVD